MNFFTIGSKFSSFEALKAALIQYKKETNVEFFIRDCKTLEQATLKGCKSARDANVDLVYQRLKLYCVRGGRPYVSNSKGQRKRTTWRLGCEAYIYLALSHCRQYLEVKDYDFEHNHEIVPRPLQRKELRAEKRRQRLMEKLNLTYAEVLQIERREEKPKEDKRSAAKNAVVVINNENNLMDNECPENVDMNIQFCEIEVSNSAFPENDDMNNPFPENNNPSPEPTPIRDSRPETIYTRTGDDGMSSTFNGERLNKDHNVFEAVGTIEELSSSIGFAIEFFPETCYSISEELREIQCVLQDLAVHVGTPKSFSTTFHKVNSDFPVEHISNLENHIANYTERLPELSDIILPSGGKGSSALHVARSICRRAERRVVGLAREGEVKEASFQYLNRLGDYLFAVARVVCLCNEEKESIYKKPKFIKPLRKLYIEPSPSLILESQPYKGCEIVFLAQPEE